MSVITIARKGGLCSMAADTTSTTGSRRVSAGLKANPSKILRFQDNLLGFVGYSAHQVVFEDLLRRHASKLDFSGRDRLFGTALKIHDLLTDHYHLRTSDSDRDQPYDSSQLVFAVANPHGIFVIDSYREVFEYSEYWAIGSGASYALGAMRVLYDQDSSNAEFIAREGAITGAAFNIYCGEPIESFALPMVTDDNPAELACACSI